MRLDRDCDWDRRPQSRLVAVAVAVALPFIPNALIKGKTQENHYSAYTANGARTARETTEPSRAQKRLQQTTGTWCSGITPAQHAGGPGFNPQCVHAGAPALLHIQGRVLRPRVAAASVGQLLRR